jgi:GldM C-terminal domain
MKNLFSLSLFLLFSLKIFTQRAVVALENMNVMYMGVGNPISVAVEGVEDSKLKVSIDNGSIVKNADSGYNVNTARTGLAIVTIEWDGKKKEKIFRVKPMPDPEPQLSLSSDYYKSFPKEMYTGVIARVVGFDIDATVTVHSFKITRIPKNGDTKELIIYGCCNKEGFDFVQKTQKDDTIIFSDIKCRCPGDNAPRLLKKTITCIIRD